MKGHVEIRKWKNHQRQVFTSAILHTLRDRVVLWECLPYTSDVHGQVSQKLAISTKQRLQDHGYSLSVFCVARKEDLLNDGEEESFPVFPQSESTTRFLAPSEHNYLSVMDMVNIGMTVEDFRANHTPPELL
jgi:hypothetical protein